MSDSIVVLDASALINLLGCGSPDAILIGCASHFAIEERTLSEVLRDPSTKRPAQSAIERLVQSNILAVHKMSPEAYSDYLDLVSGSLASALGHGEGAALAHAADVGASIVLDDKKARRIGTAKFPKCVQWTSVRLFRLATELGGMSVQESSRLIQNAKTTAGMHILEVDESWIGALPIPLHSLQSEPGN